ncbi:hypothetical protein Tco_0977732 [Tanacetum coccineum]|uniref:Uncharacterized protein n=1 Tax=Tanacetum coccineum TaxID=301880 RepID=A0ABQ5EL03_9ASTR
MNLLSESFTARIKEQVKDQLSQILPQEVTNFAPPMIEKLFHETHDEVTLAKASSQPQSTYEAASTLTEFKLKNILLDKIKKDSTSGTSKGTKTKAALYDLPGIEDMVPNIWSPVKVAYDKYTLWGISHWREQLKSFYAYARGMQSRGDVYSTKRILAVTHVSVMRKHGYGYLEEIIVRRVDNDLYRFKEGDDVADFAIALRIYTRSLHDTTRSDLRKRHPYTPYKDPQEFIYVDDFERNRLMRSDKLYKFSDGTLTRLLSSLEDITKNIDMTYLPKRRWSILKKKIAHFMIKDINKLLKERSMMRSLEKFVGGRLYRTDLRLLQRTI